MKVAQRPERASQTAETPAAPRAGGWFAIARRWYYRARNTAPGRFMVGYLGTYEANDLAATIAYRALLYTFPLLGAIATAVGLVIHNTNLLISVNAALTEILPSSVWDKQVTALLTAKDNTGLIGLVSVAGLFWLGSTLLANLGRAFNKLYNVPKRHAIVQRLVAFGLILLLAVLLVSSIIASSLVTLFVDRLDPFVAMLGLHLPGWDFKARGLALATALSTAFMLFTMLYWLIPNARQRFRDVWRGALLAALLLVAATQLFPLYVRFAPGNAYGAFFSLLFLLVTWFFLLAHIILLGAALNAFRLGRWRAGLLDDIAWADGDELRDLLSRLRRS
ncbi:MAG: YihY/virulence factor BrkB family protein [Thermomicrobiales bacterium]